MYVLEDELEDEPAFRCEFDGNNSLKRTNAFVRNIHARPDSRKARSDYWLGPQEVDEFKDEVPLWPASKNDLY